jgi:hypothetical protein
LARDGGPDEALQGVAKSRAFRLGIRIGSH